MNKNKSFCECFYAAKTVIVLPTNTSGSRQFRTPIEARYYDPGEWFASVVDCSYRTVDHVLYLFPWNAMFPIGVREFFPNVFIRFWYDERTLTFAWCYVESNPQ